MPREKTTRNALGSIFKRQVIKDGKKITVYDARKCYAEITPDGRKKYRAKSKRCYSHSEALAALASLSNTIADAPAPMEPVTHEHTFGELAEYFKKEYCKPAIFAGDRQISGFRQNHKNIEKYVDGFLEFFGDVPLPSITFEHIRSYAEYLATTPIQHYNAKTKPTRPPAPATVNRKLAYLRRMLNIGKRLRWVTVNPFSEGESLIKISNERPRERVLTFDEEDRLLAACDNDDRRHLILIIILAVDTGLRKKELFSLQRKDIDLDAKLITIPFAQTKALKTRQIIVSRRLEAELQKHFDRFTFQPDDLIFFGQKDADRAFETACRLAEIKDFKFHDLRHTATTWMDEAGVSSTAKQSMIGHASERTHRRYHNPSSDILDSAREKMDKMRKRL